MAISPHAIVHPSASLGEGVRVDAFATIDEGVTIGDRTWIASHAHIINGTEIGADCSIHQGAVVGGDPQDMKYRGEPTRLELGDRVTIREYCTINRATVASRKTSIGDDALIMAYSHVAHDCTIDKKAILANSVNLAGHVHIGEAAIIGGMTAVQQFLHIGRHAFIGGGTLIRKDVPPFIRAAREPLSYIGVNTIGLGRRGFSAADRWELQNIYRLLFVGTTNLSIGIARLQGSEYSESSYAKEILRFIDSSQNGIIRGYRQLPSKE